MIKNISGVDVNYIDYGSGDDTLVLLHGWGQNIAMMRPIGDKLQKSCRVIIIDLPGHGESSQPDEVLSIYDFASTNSIKSLYLVFKLLSIKILLFSRTIVLKYAKGVCLERIHLSFP